MEFQYNFTRIPAYSRGILIVSTVYSNKSLASLTAFLDYTKNTQFAISPYKLWDHYTHIAYNGEG